MAPSRAPGVALNVMAHMPTPDAARNQRPPMSTVVLPPPGGSSGAAVTLPVGAVVVAGALFWSLMPPIVENRSLVHPQSAARLATTALRRHAGSRPQTNLCATRRQPAISGHGRNDELRPFFDPGRPARGHGLRLGVKADRIRTVLIEIAEARAFPASERVVGKRHRDCEIDAHHADVNPGHEVARGVSVPGKNGNAIAVGVLRGQAHGFLIVFGVHHAQHGTKDFLLVDAHGGRYLIEQAATHEK